jgi:sugar lactone lactonase YvrE
MIREFTTLLTGVSYLEGPRWHDDRIWVSDMYGYRVVSAREDGSDVRVEAEVPHQPSGLGFLPDSRMLVVSMRDRKLLRREADGALVTHADLADLVSDHLNDMVVDAHGRAFVGNFGFDLMAGACVATTGLFRVDPNGSVSAVADDLWFPNGSVVTGDGTLLVNETFGNRISAFDITPDGRLTNRRAWAVFGDPPAERGLAEALGELAVAADGCSLDAEGALWVADAIGGRVIRVHEGGAIVDEIRPGSPVFACALGGRDGRTLFLCTAPDFQEKARRNAREARLVSIRVDVPHAGRP